MAQAYEVHADNGQESTAPIEEVIAPEVPVEETPTPVEETTAPEAPIEEATPTPEAPVEETVAPVEEDPATPAEEDPFAYARDLSSKNAAADDATRSIGE